ncbi:MAG: potassium channel family protein [Gammaproteobacteria bacterium]
MQTSELQLNKINSIAEVIMPKKDWVLVIRRWLGIAGISSQESPLVHRVDRFFEFALLLIAIWLPIQWYAEKHGLFPNQIYNYTNWLIWLAFVAETTVLTCITKNKFFYLLTNWVNLAIIILLFPLFWVHSVVTTFVRIVRVGLMFRFLVPWFEFTSDFLAKNHLGTTLFVAILLTTSSGLMLASFDPGIPNAGSGIWWAWQTITTVGYGDVVPKTQLGRILGILVMIGGVGLLAVLTANFSAFFMSRNQKNLLKPLDKNRLDHMHDTLLRLEQKIESLEKSLNEQHKK